MATVGFKGLKKPNSGVHSYISCMRLQRNVTLC